VSAPAASTRCHTPVKLPLTLAPSSAASPAFAPDANEASATTMAACHALRTTASDDLRTTACHALRARRMA
jgi:hypothetical protein